MAWVQEVRNSLIVGKDELISLTTTSSLLSSSQNSKLKES